MKKVRFDTLHEFIRTQLCVSINNMIEIYKGKFKERKSEVESIFERVINQTQSVYFDAKIFEDAKNIYNILYKKIGIPGY